MVSYLIDNPAFPLYTLAKITGATRTVPHTDDLVRHLTENTLSDILSSIYVGHEIIRDKAYPGCRFRPDFYIPTRKVVVEFDGYHHYMTARGIIDDAKKDVRIYQDGITVIRIPYFVQLSTITIKHLFGVDFEHAQTHPHGFIDNKAGLPADFCELGIDRFLDDLNRFDYIKSDILSSLNTKIHQAPGSNYASVITTKILHNYPEYFKCPIDGHK